MKFIRSSFAPIFILCALIALQACKAKKIVQKQPAQPTETTAAQPQPPVEQPKPQPVAEEKPAAPVEKPDYNFSNILFDFNSSILKTGSYPVLDKAAATMKMDPTAKFSLSGYASIEGTEEYNKTLSGDRANSVKVYLVNSGVSAANITAAGYGTDNPVGDNSTEAGRALNRRVEIRKQN
jgi:OOP family OmpA-OmpF porin